jgi:hypothetical protein
LAPTVRAVRQETRLRVHATEPTADTAAWARVVRPSALESTVRASARANGVVAAATAPTVQRTAVGRSARATVKALAATAGAMAQIVAAMTWTPTQATAVRLGLHPRSILRAAHSQSSQPCLQLVNQQRHLRNHGLPSLLRHHIRWHLLQGHQLRSLPRSLSSQTRLRLLQSRQQSPRHLCLSLPSLLRRQRLWRQSHTPPSQLLPQRLRQPRFHLRTLGRLQLVAVARAADLALARRTNPRRLRLQQRHQRDRVPPCRMRRRQWLQLSQTLRYLMLQ